MRKLPEVLKKLFKASQKGFTLIELLVVIGILGILITAMVATINPFEQINKGQDSKLQNIAAEFVNGNIRYYTNHIEFPWVTSVGAATCPVPAVTGSTITTLIPCIENYLDSSGDSELKDSFTSVDGLDQIWIYSTGTTLRACYAPVSISGRKNKVAKYTNKIGTTTDTSPSGVCPAYNPAGTGVDGTGTCYWCTE